MKGSLSEKICDVYRVNWRQVRFNLGMCKHPLMVLKISLTPSLVNSSSCRKEKMITKMLLHWPGIEPGPPAWQARILPLNHQCLMKYSLICLRRYLSHTSQCFLKKFFRDYEEDGFSCLRVTGDTYPKPSQIFKM